jgi:hypothetical protein
MTYSVETKIPPLVSPTMYSSLGLSYNASITASPHTNQFWWVVSPFQSRYKIQMNTTEGFQTLLNSGEKFFSQESGIFVVSKHQLDLLQDRGIALIVLGPSD